MRAGRLRHLITLERLVLTAPNEFGERVKQWVAIPPDAWASVDPISLTMMAGAKEVVTSGADGAADIFVLTLYAIDGIEPDTWRFWHKGRLYDIKATRPSNDDATMVFLAVKGALDGPVDPPLHVIIDGSADTPLHVIFDGNA